MLMSKTVKLAFVQVAMAVSTASYAGGGGLTGGSTEFTQIANNAELIADVAENAAAAATLAQQYTQQILQWEREIKNITGFDALKQGISEAKSALDSFNKLRSTVTSLRGNLMKEVETIEDRFSEAKLMKKGWKEYVAQVATDVATKNQRAIGRLKQESEIMKNVEKDYDLIRDLQSEVKGTVGMQQSLQLLNEQMNKVLVQNNQLIEILASAHYRDQGEKEAAEAEAANARARIIEEMTARQNQIKANRDNFVPSVK